MEAIGHIGWPFTRWVQAFRPRPLRRLRLEDKTIEVRDQDVRSVLGRSSIPPPSPAAKAAVALATRNLAGVAGAGLPTPWADAVDAAADPPGGSLTDDLDRAVVATPLRGRNPIWWRLIGVVHVLLALSAINARLDLGAFVYDPGNGELAFRLGLPIDSDDLHYEDFAHCVRAVTTTVDRYVEPLRGIIDGTCSATDVIR